MAAGAGTGVKLTNGEWKGVRAHVRGRSRWKVVPNMCLKVVPWRANLGGAGPRQPREIFSDADGPDSSENTKISSRIQGGIAARG